MLNVLNLPIHQVYLMMGFKCNLSCRYCIEHDVVNHAMAKEIDPMIIDWLLDIANNIHPINILFWGGEPLVYFDTMQKVVDMVKSKEGNENITFSMVTNGKLLNDKTIPWIKENLNGFGLSWDGRNSKITRGYDVIAQNKENLFKLDKEGFWGFDGVFSSYCYPKDYLDDCYEVQKEFGHEISVHIENLMQYDTELPNPQLKKFDENKFYQQMEEICEEYLYCIKNDKIISNPMYIKFIEDCNCGCDKTPTRLFCGNGGENINLDLQGNLYCCHGDSEVMGTIHDNYFDVLKNINDHDKTIEHGLNGCNDCSVQSLCRNACPKIPQSSRDEFYCRMATLRYYPILKLKYELDIIKNEKQKEEYEFMLNFKG